ncbi:DUF2938 domain-containing protein [Pseudorhodoplanes sinuspersici]|uniref:Uncharacterized protein n=1 Tax=Pseudorhodoplanes sinuspersici TaxID=1235591 RepID=A0A1W6ZL65_9HYPH|nr:DUF2938 domain-containing protein [Pseudorhodoplanes sinuspersici]ARP97977.1 hypothetical protein CAK95_01950 [Pseudorhodoplanes sinuspersici]RKE68272.1 DUF2938 family protein [Pseudorhodoplanes sinuspersici]
MEFVLRAVLMGVGATVLMDLWAVFLKRAFAISSLDYAMVGRWLGHMAAGRFTHARIAASPAIRGERAIGWAAHYAIGIIFAGLLLIACGPGWARSPTLGPALAAGILTVAAPFFILQPGLGLGIAASRTPKPNLARIRSLVTHTIFGFGLYGSAEILAKVMPP